MHVERRDEDIQNEITIRDFLNRGCGCKWGCHNKLNRELIERRRASCAALSRTDLDLVLLGQLAASETCGSARESAQRAQNAFRFEGKRVCKATFLVVG